MVYVNWTFIAIVVATASILLLARFLILDHIHSMLARLTYVVVVGVIFVGSMVLGLIVSKSKTVLSITTLNETENESNKTQEGIAEELGKPSE